MEVPTILIIVAAMAALFVMSQPQESTFISHMEAPEEKVPSNPALGEDNPIVQTWSKLANNGLWNPAVSGLDAFDNSYQSLLWEQGVMKRSEVDRHKLYYGSNVGKYPFVGRSTPIDHKVTRNPYVGFTRAMRAVKIRDSDMVVPDKIENPVPPR